uniref:hypothetical protein n=1 Tax=Kocuria rosea TaxID=1275 RepID=UPI001C92F7D2
VVARIGEAVDDEGEGCAVVGGREWCDVVGEEGLRVVWVGVFVVGEIVSGVSIKWGELGVGGVVGGDVDGWLEGVVVEVVGEGRRGWVGDGEDG